MAVLILAELNGNDLSEDATSKAVLELLKFSLQ